MPGVGHQDPACPVARSRAPGLRSAWHLMPYLGTADHSWLAQDSAQSHSVQTLVCAPCKEVQSANGSSGHASCHSGLADTLSVADVELKGLCSLALIHE